MKILVSLWYSKNRWAYLLLPFSYLYRLLFWFHQGLYKLNIKKIFVAPIPLVVVGNLTVGGTGKTPFTIALAKLLLSHGFKPGIISRGYKGKAKQFPQIVDSKSDPILVGDEPILIAKQTACPLVVDPERAKAVRALLKNFDCDVILSDDGLQHHALKKDLEIALVDQQYLWGNGFCLPAGPLRQSLKKLNKVDFLVMQGSDSTAKYNMHLQVQDFYNLCDSSIKFDLKEIKAKTIHAVAGIGFPDRFFSTLQQLDLDFIRHPFPDHYAFKAEDFLFCDSQDILIMTEKDAVKCQQFAKNNYWVLSVRSCFNDDFIKDFMSKLTAIAYAKKSIPEIAG